MSEIPDGELSAENACRSRFASSHTISVTGHLHFDPIGISLFLSLELEACFDYRVSPIKLVELSVVKRNQKLGHRRIPINLSGYAQFNNSPDRGIYVGTNRSWLDDSSFVCESRQFFIAKVSQFMV
jgi:hypothetical protein